MSRRQAVKILGAGLVVAAAGLAGGYEISQANKQSVTQPLPLTQTITETGTVTSTYDYGKFPGQTLHVEHSGAEAPAIQKWVTDPWMNMTGANVVVEYGATSMTIGKVRAQKDDPLLDVVLCDEVGADTLGAEGLLVRLDPGKIPNMDEIYPRFITKDFWGAGFWNFQDTIVYNTNAPEFQNNVPDTYELFWNPKFKNRYFMAPWSWGDGVALIALIAHMLGKNEYSVDDQVWNKIAALKPQILTYADNFSATAELFKSGDIAIGYYSPQTFAADILIPKKPYPIGIGAPKEGEVGIYGIVSKVANGPALKQGNEAMVDSYINYALSKQAQLGIASALWYGICNATITRDDFRSVGVPDWVVVGPEEYDKLVTFDWAYISTVRDAWLQKVNTLMA